MASNFFFCVCDRLPLVPNPTLNLRLFPSVWWLLVSSRRSHQRGVGAQGRGRLSPRQPRRAHQARRRLPQALSRDGAVATAAADDGAAERLRSSSRSLCCGRSCGERRRRCGSGRCGVAAARAGGSGGVVAGGVGGGRVPAAEPRGPRHQCALHRPRVYASTQ